MLASKASKIWSAAGFIPPLFLITVFCKRKEHLEFFHAKQALGVWSLFLAAYVFSLLPGPFFALAKWPVCITLYILFAYLFIQGFIAAARGEKTPLPLIGEYVDRLAVFKENQAR